MKKMYSFLSLTASILFTGGIYAQCSSGQVAVTVDVTTDSWGYECFWDVTPSGNGCGNGALFTFGNTTDITCSGGGAGVASSGNGYADDSTITEDLGCLQVGTCYDINYVDDYGDGGAEFTVKMNGIEMYSFVPSDTTSSATFTFCGSEPPVNDAKIVAGTNEYTIYPLSQVQNIVASAILTSAGTGNITGVNMTATVSFNSSVVYTATSSTQDLNSLQSGTFSVSGYVPSQSGMYTVTLVAGMTETDEDLSNNTVSYQVEVSDSVYARDDNTLLSSIGFGAGEDAYLGLSFTVYDGAMLSSVSTFIDNSDASLTGTTYQIDVFNVDPATDMPDTVVASASTVFAVDSAQWFTLNFSPAVNLNPGKYVFALKEFASNTQNIGFTASNFTASTGYISSVSNTWDYVENYSFYYVFMIRPNLNQYMNVSGIESVPVVTVYPNPANSFVTVDGVQTGDMISVFDVKGVQVLNFKATNVQETMNIDVLSKGLYTVKINSADQVSVVKFVKE